MMSRKGENGRMAKFRMVHTEFWDDPRVVEEMTPEDKFFYLYLLTNSNTTQIGIYQITKKQIAFDMGYSIESINSLMDRFINFHKIISYNTETRELAIKNWGKYNFNKGGKPILDCIKSELKQVKDKSLIRLVAERVEKKEIKEIYESFYDTSTISGQEKEEEKEKEIIVVVDEQESNPFQFFEENGFGTISPLISENIDAWCNDLSADLVEEAMKVAVKSGVKKWSYVESILRDWADKQFNSVEQVHAAMASFKEQRASPKRTGQLRKKPTKEDFNLDD
jgi:DnaD/phage-associated family protein